MTLSTRTLNATVFNIMTFCIMTLSITTLSIKALNITTIIGTTLNIKAFSITRPNNANALRSVTLGRVPSNAKCCYGTILKMVNNCLNTNIYTDLETPRFNVMKLFMAVSYDFSK
jgi:hypothetical protein